MPISYHFRDCKALLLTKPRHYGAIEVLLLLLLLLLSGAIACPDLYPYLHLMCVCPSLFGPIVGAKAHLRVSIRLPSST